MKQVELISSHFEIKFTHNGYEMDSINLKETRGSTLYFTGIKKGIRMTSVNKRIQFDDNGNVFVKFGKEKLIVGTYKELAA